MGNFKSIHKLGKDEFKIKKSTFISMAAPVKNEEDANKFIEKNREIYPDANHNCYAYVIGEEKLIQKASDDGEPSQSAGIPILEVIKREDLTDICLVVNRYFGGIKLGKSGLSRAYAKGAKKAIDDGIIVEKVLSKLVKLTVDYQFLGIVENYLLTNEYYIKDKKYTENVDIFIIIEDGDYDKILRDLNNLLSANFFMEGLDDFYLSCKEGKLIIE